MLSDLGRHGEPAAHDDLMKRMMHSYLTQAEEAGRELDAELARPIVRRQLDLRSSRE